MGLAENIAYVGALLDHHAATAWKMGVVAEEPEDEGVPPAMQVGAVNAEGWVEWRILPSTLNEADVLTVEHEFGVRFPPLFRAYLLARFHLFSQVRSQQYAQPLSLPPTPSSQPLGPMRELLEAWRPLIDAGFVPCAEWGDGWGPVCFDAQQQTAAKDYPVVWIDHEHLVSLGPERCRLRDEVLPHAQPLYGSCRELLMDAFGAP